MMAYHRQRYSSEPAQGRVLGDRVPGNRVWEAPREASLSSPHALSSIKVTTHAGYHQAGTLTCAPHLELYEGSVRTLLINDGLTGD